MLILGVGERPAAHVEGLVVVAHAEDLDVVAAVGALRGDLGDQGAGLHGISRLGDGERRGGQHRGGEEMGQT